MKGAYISITVENTSNRIRFYDELPDNVKAKKNSTKPMYEGPRINLSTHCSGVTADVNHLSAAEDFDAQEPHQTRNDAFDMNVPCKSETLCSHKISMLKSNPSAAMKNTEGNIGPPN